MSARFTGSHGRTHPAGGSVNVQQLREKIGQLLTAAGQHSQQQKTDYLNQYFAKWSMNQQRMNHQQFMGALQSLHLPLAGAGEVFGALDADASGYVEIREFCDGMIGPMGSQPAATPPRSATQNAGSAIINSGRPPSGDRPAAMPVTAAERGYTPSRTQPTQKTVGGSRNGSRNGTANRSPGVPGTPQPQQMSTMKPPPAPRAAPSRPQADLSRGPTEVDFSDMVVDKFRAIVLARGGSSGIHSLGRIFRIMDDDRNRRISMEELSYGLQDFGLRLAVKDLQLLLAAIDKDNTGSLSFDEFLNSIRGVVNARRQKLINMAFDVLDSTGDGIVTVDDLAGRFHPQGHPDVMRGGMDQSQALGNFLSQFDGADQNGVVTRDEFLEYYKNLSASVDDDDYFELMIRNAWHIAGGQGQYQNTANTRLLVTLVDGTQKVVCIEHDLGLDLRNAADVKARLKAQGISNVASYSTGGLC